MTLRQWKLVGLFLFFVSTPALRAAPAEKPMEVLTATLARWADVISPAPGEPAKTFVTRATVSMGGGRPYTADLAFQAPDRLRVVADVKGKSYSAGRDGQTLWAHVPHKQFALLGKSGVPRFQTHPDELDDTQLAPFRSPVEPGGLALALALKTRVILEPSTDQDLKRLKLVWDEGGKRSEVRLTLRAADLLPLRAAYVKDGKSEVEVEFENPRFEEAWPAEKWSLDAGSDVQVQTVALAHLVRFLKVAPDGLFNNHVPTLGPATGRREIVAREGRGRLEKIDGTRVLFLKGSPSEMGRQHGTLLKKEILHTMNRILYGVGVGSSFDRGKWFFGEIEHAQARVEKFTDPRYLEEMDAIASAVGAHKQEGRLANFFPELFHCSGFCVFGKATQDGRMYHGRVLDYMRGIGLEQNAVVIVHQPDGGRHAWVNVSYAGFVGTVTAMNEKGISIGEMGGMGYGKWDGTPMAQLLREVMEKADTIEEALEILRSSPRTCEYYYVIADGNKKTAVGVAATPEAFETVAPGQSHPRLPHGVEDAVLLSAGDRYEELVRRVKTNYGKLDVAGSRDLMTRPVCMTSNIHSVLFAPETLDLWVANADSKNVASDTRYTHYNLRDLLKAEGTASASPVRAQ